MSVARPLGPALQAHLWARTWLQLQGTPWVLTGSVIVNKTKMTAKSQNIKRNFFLAALNLADPSWAVTAAFLVLCTDLHVHSSAAQLVCSCQMNDFFKKNSGTDEKVKIQRRDTSPEILLLVILED